MDAWMRVGQVRNILLSTKLSLEDVWVQYYAIGGAASRFELEASLAGVLVLTGEECEVLVEATNSLLCTLPTEVRISGDVNPSPERSKVTGGHALGAAGAFLLTPLERERERVEAAVRTGLLDTAPEDRFDRISRQAMQLFQVSSVMITIIDDRRCFGKSVIGPLQRDLPRTQSLSGAALYGAGATIIGDLSGDPRFRGNPFVLGDPHLRFFGGHPLHGPRGWKIGALCIADQHPKVFSVDDAHALHALAQQVEDEINGPRVLPGM